MLIDMSLPPGLQKNGTIRQAKGRWYMADKVRWTQGVVAPIGGWQARSASTVTGSARAIWTWVDNGAAKWIAIGTHSKLYVMKRDGSLFDITPVGLTVGRADASVAGGYGAGTYGSGLYGTPRLTTGLVQDATVWTLDNYGEDLIGCNADDGKIYLWDTSVGTGTVAAALTGAPTSNRACMMTEEGFVVALGAGGDPRVVQWSDKRGSTTWTPSATNESGSYTLQTSGRIMCGRRTRGAHLIFTDQDVHQGVYQGPPYVYGYQRVGEGCGIVSQAAAVASGNMVAWMGSAGFWVYDGYVRPLPSDCWDYVFSDFNQVQKSKVFAIHNPDFSEITWHYPSGGSTEVNRYVTWNTQDNTWWVGTMDRTCGIERGAFHVPIMVGTDGVVYEHETGNAMGGAQPYCETGPFEWPDATGIGNRVYTVLLLRPDERTIGDVQATFYVRMSAEDTDTTYGPYTLTDRTMLRFTGREVRMRLTGVALSDWRVGAFQMEVKPRGFR